MIQYNIKYHSGWWFGTQLWRLESFQRVQQISRTSSWFLLPWYPGVIPSIWVLQPLVFWAISYVPLVFDPAHDNHVITLIPQGQRCVYRGFLNGDFSKFTILDCKFAQQYPVPKFEMTPSTLIMEHTGPSWHSLHKVTELCSGMGALGHGSTALGFQTIVGNDMNEKMAQVFTHHSALPCVIGDIWRNDVIH